MKILLADDEPLIRTTLRDDLEEAGHAVELASDGDSAMETLAAGGFDCLVTDVKMPGADGFALLAAAKAKGMDAVVMTGHGSVSMAVEAMRLGAFDFLEKPFLGVELLRVLERVAEKRAGGRHTRVILKESEERRSNGFQAVLGGNAPAFKLAMEAAAIASQSDATLLIVGESGTGKEVAAKAVHEESSRWRGPFVAVSCGALSPALLDDELFGHERGAFTDAKAARAGRFEEANGGTMFLDDIDDMRLDTQVKLLRVLQEREVRRIGSMDSRRIDIRVIAATKVDLDQLCREGRFRNDLFYRLQVLRLDLPPLRNRMEDMPALLGGLVSKHNQGPPVRVSSETLARLAAYPWPGNVRELENSVCRALAMRGAREELLASDLLPPGVLTEEDGDMTLGRAVRKAEREHIRKVLALAGGNRSQAASILGISRKNLWEKMRQLEIGDDK